MIKRHSDTGFCDTDFAMNGNVTGFTIFELGLLQTTSPKVMEALKEHNCEIHDATV